MRSVRATRVTTLTAAATALFAGVAGLANAAASDWPCWRGANYDGISRETQWSTEGKEAWRKELGLGYSSPSIVDGRLYTLGFDASENEDVVYCLDTADGTELWTHRSPAEVLDNMHEGGVLTTPTVADGNVYVLSRMGPLWCLDAATGEVRWTRPVSTELAVKIDPFGINTSPLIFEGMVIVNVGRTAAYDADSGEAVWQTEDYGYSYGTPVPFMRGGEPALAVFNGKGLTVLDASTGEQLLLHPWTTKFNVNCATPILLDRKVFISTGYDNKGCALLDVSGDSIEVVWENKNMRNNMSGCVLLDGYLYGFDDKQLTCIDAQKGETRWSVRGSGAGALSAANGRLIVMQETGELSIAPAEPEAFAPSVTAKVFEEGVCWTPPVLCDGRIYCRNNKGSLVCRDHRSPAKRAGTR